jgi:hypothetical protein
MLYWEFSNGELSQSTHGLSLAIRYALHAVPHATQMRPVVDRSFAFKAQYYGVGHPLTYPLSRFAIRILFMVLLTRRNNHISSALFAVDN